MKIDTLKFILTDDRICQKELNYQSNYKQIVMFYVVARITHTLHYCQFSDILTVII